MKRWRGWPAVVCAAALAVSCAIPAAAAPTVGYVYPAGGQQGATFTVTIGGQSLRGSDDIYVTGDGIRASVEEYVPALGNQELSKVQRVLRDLVRRRWVASVKDSAYSGLMPGEAPLPDHPWLRDLDERSPIELERLRQKLFDPRAQPNAQIGEQLVLTLTIDADAAPGYRELRVVSPTGMSNPMRFQVGTLPEVCEEDFTGPGSSDAPEVEMPVLINGQIMPGEVDRWTLRAKKGQRLVAQAQARKLIPYLADAVPGWFQATLTLYDPSGKEVAFCDDYRFDPDPVLMYEVPADGLYRLEVCDSIYRGRADFIYRISAGELPFVTEVFPLGGSEGEEAVATISGWNLPSDRLTLDTAPGGSSVRRMKACPGALNEVCYAVDALREVTESEPNDEASEAEEVAFPAVVNGRIGQVGDTDVFSFSGAGGEEIVAEIHARRLESPLDSTLRLTDGAGNQLAFSDDYKDRERGVITHQADSYLRLQLPADGTYHLSVADSQRTGGEAYAYRLQIRPAQPDFALRLVPSGLNIAAGRSAKALVHAIRKDGFEGPITLSLADAPEGFTVSEATIAADAESAEISITAPRGASRQVVRLRIEGTAEIAGASVTRPAVAAEDMMQAFLWRFLVPQQELAVAITGERAVPAVWRPLVPGMKLTSQAALRLDPGDMAQVQVEAPKVLPDSRKSALESVRFRISSQPRGISLRETRVVPTGVVLTLKADRNMTLPGDTGNVIVEAYIEPPGERRVALGVLPAIPIEIVSR